MSWPILHDTSVNGEQLALLLAQPDWTRGMSFEIDVNVSREVSMDGRESRQSHGSPRWKMRYSAVLRDFEAHSLLQWLGNTYDAGGTVTGTPLHDHRIAVPFWPDWGTWTWDSTQFVAAEYVVTSDLRGGFTVDTWVNATGGASPFSPGSTPFASLLCGRFAKKPKLRALKHSLYQVDFELEEDAPDWWAWTVTGDAGDWTPSDWPQPDWTEKPDGGPVDKSRSNLLGRGRSKYLLDTESAATWRLSAGFLLGRSVGRRTLDWVINRRGLSFDAPVWFQPVVPDDHAPSAIKAIVADESIKIDFPNQRIVKFGLTFDEAIWEYTSSPGIIQEPLGFRFFIPGLTGGIRCTDWESQQTAGANNYVPASIEVDFSWGNGFEDQMTVRLDGFDLPMLASHPLHCECFRLSGGSEELVFSGSLLSQKQTEEHAEMIFAPAARVLSGIEVPNAYFSRVDNNSLADHGISAHTGMAAPGDASGDTITLTIAGIPSINDPDGNPHDWFAGGFLILGDTFDTVDSYRVKSGSISGSSVTLTLTRPVELTATKPFFAWPGYDGAYWQAVDKFSLGSAFFGFPNTPDYLDEIAYRAPDVGK